MPFAKWRKFQVGRGKGRAGFTGLQKVNTTPVGNVGSGEDDLISTTLEANSLHKAGQAVRITAWGHTANNSATKTIKLFFGSVAIMTNALTVSIAGNWMIQALVIRKTSTTADAIAGLVGGATSLADCERTALSSLDFTADTTIKCTGTATSNDDLIQDGLIVEALTQ